MSLKNSAKRASHISWVPSHCACPKNSHVGIASHNNSRSITSANDYLVNGPHHYNSRHHVQEPIISMNSSKFNAINNIQHAYTYS
jgi:hypothetical protein